MKVASIRGLEAELVLHGSDFDEARAHAEELALNPSVRVIGVQSE